MCQCCLAEVCAHSTSLADGYPTTGGDPGSGPHAVIRSHPGRTEASTKLPSNKQELGWLLLIARHRRPRCHGQVVGHSSLHPARVQDDSDGRWVKMERIMRTDHGNVRLPDAVLEEETHGGGGSQ